jgi:hypothetical protein
MAYTQSQIISFVLFLILVCLSVVLIVLSATKKYNDGGGMFSSFKSAAKSAASSAASVASSAASSAASVASSAASSAAATTKDFAVIKSLESVLLMNQIKLTPKEYLTDMKGLYNEDKFSSYLKDTITKANARIGANNGIIAEYKRRDGDSTYVKEKNKYPELIKKYTEDNEELSKIIADCNKLLGTKLVSKLQSAVNPIIEPEISAMTTKTSLRGTDLMSTAIAFSNSLPSVGPSAFPI